MQAFFFMLGVCMACFINIILFGKLMYGVEKQSLRWQRAVAFWDIFGAFHMLFRVEILQALLAHALFAYMPVV